MVEQRVLHHATGESGNGFGVGKAALLRYILRQLFCNDVDRIERLQGDIFLAGMERHCQ